MVRTGSSSSDPDASIVGRAMVRISSSLRASDGGIGVLGCTLWGAFGSGVQKDIGASQKQSLA